jgi:tetratricopeptide (TPR) repeat protein
VDVNAKDEYGQSPLVYAEGKGVAELLLAKGASINAQDKRGRTPLYFAANKGMKDIVELLLAKGANVNAKDNAGETPLHYAATSKKKDKDIVELLLVKGADVNAKDKEGFTPLDVAYSVGTTPDIYDLLENYVVKHAKNPRELFEQLSQQQNNLMNRHLIIKLASELKPVPVIPEEARRHFVEGTAIVKAAKNPAQQALAAQSFTEALKIAPWWGDAYYNLGVAQELAEKYDEAEQAFNFYLLSKPSEMEKREVQDRIYGLSAKRKLAGVKE